MTSLNEWAIAIKKEESETLDEFFNDHQMFHSNFQIDHFIIGQSGTEYGQYKQVLREVVKRWRGLKQQVLLRHETELKLRKWEQRLGEMPDALKAEKANLKIMKFKMALEETDRVLEGTRREFLRFLAHAKALKAKIGELTPEKRDQLDADMWEHNLKAMAALDLVTSGRLSEATVRMLRYFPSERRLPLIELLTTRQADLIDWYETHDTLTQLEAPEPLAALE